MTLESQNRRRIDIIRDDAFTTDLSGIDMDELRARRRMCDELDTELSYYRRLLHGRLDLLAFEQSRRAGTETRSLIEALPEILAGSDVGHEPRNELPKELPIEAPDMPEEGRRAIDRALGDDFLTHLPSLDDEDLDSIQSNLVAVEAEISGQRADVYAAYEKVNDELTRRYRDGLANVDELLSR